MAFSRPGIEKPRVIDKDSCNCSLESSVISSKQQIGSTVICSSLSRVMANFARTIHVILLALAPRRYPLKTEIVKAKISSLLSNLKLT